MMLRFILTVCASLLWPIGLCAQEDLFSLSLKELLYVPDKPNYQGRGIFQSDQLKLSKDSVNFGLIVPLSNYPLYSTELIAAADLAAMAINREGGIAGKPLIIVRADSAHLPAKSAELAARMISRYSVSAIIGPNDSDSTREVLEKVTIPKRIPLITQVSSSTELSHLDGIEFFWRMIASNQQQVELIVFHLEKLNRQQGVFLLGNRDLYSDEILNGVKNALAKKSIKTVGEMRISDLVDMSEIDLQQEIERIQSLAPSAIVFTFRAKVAASFLQKLNAVWQGEFPLIIAGDIIKQTDLEGPEVARVASCTAYLVSSNQNAADNELKKEIAKLLDTKATGNDAAYVYDSVILFAMAKNIEAQLKVNFKQALNQITSDGKLISYQDYAQSLALYKQNGKLSFSGMSGPVSFNSLGDNTAAEMKLVSFNPTSQPLPPCQSALRTTIRK